MLSGLQTGQPERYAADIGGNLGTDSDRKLSTTLAGVAGEYFVAAELSRRGYLASITLRNSKGVDLLASNAEATRSVAIQVKTNQGSKPDWILSSGAETFYSETHFYVFVNLNGLTGHPHYHIVPSVDVAELVRETHASWLASPGRQGQLRHDSSIRKFSDPSAAFRDRWDLLGL